MIKHKCYAANVINFWLRVEFIENVPDPKEIYLHNTFELYKEKTNYTHMQTENIICTKVNIFKNNKKTKTFTKINELGAITMADNVKSRAQSIKSLVN